jgi:hypothetical protein
VYDTMLGGRAFFLFLPNIRLVDSLNGVVDTYAMATAVNGLGSLGSMAR